MSATRSRSFGLGAVQNLPEWAMCPAGYRLDPNNKRFCYPVGAIIPKPLNGLGAVDRGLGNLAATLGDVLKLGLIGGMGFAVGHYFGGKAARSSGGSLSASEKKLTKKQIDKLIEQTYYKHGSGVQIDIMNINKIFNAGHAAYSAGQSLDDAIVAAIAKYREN